MSSILLEQLNGQAYCMRNLSHQSETLLVFKDDENCVAWGLESNFRQVDDRSLEVTHSRGNKSTDFIEFSNDCCNFSGYSSANWSIEGWKIESWSKDVIVFNIGLPRTGTTSICKAFERLGFLSNHAPLSLDLDDYNIPACFYSDTPIWNPCFFVELMKRYPKSKFVWTQRDVDSWLRSCRRFFGTHTDVMKCNEVDRQSYLGVFGQDIFPFNDEAFVRGYEFHQEQVKNTFLDCQDRILAIDITDSIASSEQKWKAICDFVGVHNSSIEFPHVGRSKK